MLINLYISQTAPTELEFCTDHITLYSILSVLLVTHHDQAVGTTTSNDTNP